MSRATVALLTLACSLAAPPARAAEPASAPHAEAASEPVHTTRFGDRFFRGTSPGKLPTAKLAVVAGLYLGAAASVGVSVASLVGASSKRDEAESFKLSSPPGFCLDLASPSCSSYRRLRSEADRRRETGLLLLGAGGLLVVGGALTAELWHNDDGPQLALAVAPGGLGFTATGRF